MEKCWGMQDVEWMHVTTRQNSGGLILTWKEGVFIMSNAIAMPRWLCVIGEIQEIQKVCAVCLVYAPNSHQERLTMWDQQGNQLKCPFCTAQKETLSHILMSYPVSWTIWCIIARIWIKCYQCLETLDSILKNG
uniref:Reverse transcriptase zinc-binding domain-containing protein n=1 Tax=Opuntia streptacantha TaxID=393608 RepID=A0A7C8ZM11_OPUST